MKTDPIVQEDLIPGSGMNHQQSQAELERQAILEKQKVTLFFQCFNNLIIPLHNKICL